MAALVKAQSFRVGGLQRVFNVVMEHGDKVSPRGQETTEVRGFTLELDDPADSLLTRDIRPNFSPGIAAAEAAQLIGGISDPNLMGKVSPNFLKFRNGGTLLGAYGPRIRTQLPQVEKRLREDASNRQTVLTIWDPMTDLWSDGVYDLPCTTLFQFFIRDNKLDMQTYMRSNDVWWGLCYDVFQFTQLQLALAVALDVAVGKYVHTAGSMHVYARDYDKQSLVQQDVTTPPPVEFDGYMGRNVLGDIRSSMKWCEELVTWAGGNSDTEPDVRIPSDGQTWYIETLRKYRDD